MVERDVTPATALDALASAGEQIGLTAREVSTTVRSAYRSVLGTAVTHESSPKHPPALSLGDAVSRAWTVSQRWAVRTAVAGTVFIAVGAFWLSFTALADLAERSGIGANQAWAWPLIVDGIIVVATVAVAALAGDRSAWYPWALLACGAVVSVTANAIHAVIAVDADVPAVLTIYRTEACASFPMLHFLRPRRYPNP